MRLGAFDKPSRAMTAPAWRNGRVKVHRKRVCSLDLVVAKALAANVHNVQIPANQLRRPAEIEPFESTCFKPHDLAFCRQSRGLRASCDFLHLGRYDGDQQAVAQQSHEVRSRRQPHWPRSPKVFDDGN